MTDILDSDKSDLGKLSKDLGAQKLGNLDIPEEVAKSEPKYKSVDQLRAESTEEDINTLFGSKTNGQIPVQASYANTEHRILTGSTYQPTPAPEPKPGFFETLGHAFVKSNEFLNLDKAINNALEYVNPMGDNNEGFEKKDWATILESNNITDLRYFSYITDARSDSDLQARIDEVHAEMKSDEYFSKGSGIADLTGGVLGYAMSPSSLIPIAKSVRMANAGVDIISNALRVVPTMGAASLAHNLVVDTADKTKKAQDYIIDTAIDTTFGAALAGGGAGLSKLATGGKLYAARKLATAAGEDIGFKQVIGEDGAVSLKAYSIDGVSASAAVLDEWTIKANQGLNRSGFMYFPFMDNLFGVGNDYYKFLTSKWKTSRDFIVKAFDSDFVTSDIAAGEARLPNIEKLVRHDMDLAGQVSANLNVFWMESNGVTGNVLTKQIQRLLKKKIDSGNYIPREEFYRMVVDSIYTDSIHEIEAVNKAANVINKHNEPIYKAYLKSEGLSEEIFSPRTALAYVMRIADRDAMIQRASLPDGSGFVEVVGAYYKQANQVKKELLKPMEDLREELKTLERRKLSELDNQELLSDLIKSTEDKIKEEKKEFRAKLKDNPDLQIHLEDRNWLSSDEEVELSGILKERNKLKKQVDEAKTKHNEINQLRFFKQKKLNKIKSKKKAEATIKEIEALDKEIPKLKEKVTEAEDALEFERVTLETKARSGLINRRFFMKLEEGEPVIFRDPNEMPKLTPAIPDDEVYKVAESMRLKYLEYSPEQLGLDSLSKVSNNAESPIKGRTHLIPDSVLRENNFLSNDLDKMVSLYTSTLSRQTHINNLLVDPIHGKGFKGLQNSYAAERELKQKEILKQKLPAEKQKKALATLGKEFEKEINKAKQLSNLLTNNTAANSGVRRVFTAIRNYTMSTRLGATPIASLPDVGGVMLKQGVWPYLTKGLYPHLQSLFDAKGKHARNIKESSAHLAIAVDALRADHANLMFNPTTSSSLSGIGRIESVLNTAKNLTMKLSGQHAWDNFMQRTVALTADSKFMSYLHKYMDGTITKRQNIALLNAGIDPKKWAKIMVKEFKASKGEKSLIGGYQSHFYDWEHYDAQQVFSQALRHEVTFSTLKSGWLDGPLWANDPVMGMFVLFQKWGFTAMNNWILPSLQRPQLSQLNVIVMMLSLGALVDPLRRLARGEQFKFDDDAAFLNAFSNSSLGGWQMSLLEQLNVALGYSLLKNKNDRRHAQSAFGTLGGPAGGVADAVFKLLQSAKEGKISQVELKRAINLIPMANLWQLRALVQKFTEATNLPQTKASAQSIWGS